MACSKCKELEKIIDSLYEELDEMAASRDDGRDEDEAWEDEEEDE